MSTAMTREEALALSRECFEKLASHDPRDVKIAAEVAEDYTRTKIREDGFFRKLIPMQPITNADLHKHPVYDKPYKIVEIEPDSPAAITVGFATQPQNLYIRGRKYEIGFDRILTPRFTKDVDELRMWDMDIRTILSDNAIKDMLAEEDGKFMRTVNTALVGPGLVVPTSGTVQYVEISGAVTRESICDALAVMTNTPSNLETHTILVNHTTMYQLMKATPGEVGETISEEMVRDGWKMTKWMGKELIVTIKKGLVPTNTMYMFADPKFIGKSYGLEDTKMYIRREAFMLEFFAYELIGGAVGNTSGIARADFI